MHAERGRSDWPALAGEAIDRTRAVGSSSLQAVTKGSSLCCKHPISNYSLYGNIAPVLARIFFKLPKA